MTVTRARVTFGQAGVDAAWSERKISSASLPVLDASPPDTTPPAPEIHGSDAEMGDFAT